MVEPREEGVPEPVLEGEFEGEPEDGLEETGEVVDDEAREETILEPVLDGEPDDG